MNEEKTAETKKTIADLTDILLEKRDNISQISNYQLTQYSSFAFAFAIFNLSCIFFFSSEGFCISFMLFYLVSILLEIGLCYSRKFKGPAIYHLHISRIIKFLAIAILLLMQGNMTPQKSMSVGSITCFIVMVISLINVIANTAIDAF